MVERVKIYEEHLSSGGNYRLTLVRREVIRALVKSNIFRMKFGEGDFIEKLLSSPGLVRIDADLFKEMLLMLQTAKLTSDAIDHQYAVGEASK